MTEPTLPVDQPVEAEEEHAPSVWSLLVDVVARPVPAFAAIARRQGVAWLLPAFLVIGTGLIALVVFAPYLAEEAKRQFQAQLLSMPPDQAEMVRAQAERFMSARFVAITGGLTSVIIQVLIWLLMSALLYVLALLGGGEVSYTAAWAMAPWLTLPSALRNILTAAWTYTQGALVKYPGLSSLVATGDLTVDQRNPLVALLAQVDPFNLWHVVLVYAAFRGGFKMGRGTALVLTIVYAAIMLGVSTLPVFLGRMFS